MPARKLREPSIKTRPMTVRYSQRSLVLNGNSTLISPWGPCRLGLNEGQDSSQLRFQQVNQSVKMSFGYKKALVIGATSGIGRAIAEKLVQNGISTIIAGRRKENLDDFVRKYGSDKAQAEVVDILRLDEVWQSPFQCARQKKYSRPFRSLNSPPMSPPRTQTSISSSSTPASNVHLTSPILQASTWTSSTKNSSPITPPLSV